MSNSVILSGDEIKVIVEKTLALISEPKYINLSNETKGITMLSAFSETVFSQTRQMYQISTPKVTLQTNCKLLNHQEIVAEDNDSIISPRAACIETVSERREWEANRRRSSWQLAKLVDYLLTQLKQKLTSKSEEIHQFIGYIQETFGIPEKSNNMHQITPEAAKTIKQNTTENLLLMHNQNNPFYGIGFYDEFTPTAGTITPQQSSPLSFTSSTISNYPKSANLWNTLSPEKLPKVIKHTLSGLDTEKKNGEKPLLKSTKKTSEHEETVSPAVSAKTMVFEIIRNDQLLVTDYTKNIADNVYPTLRDLSAQYSEALQLSLRVLENKNSILKETVKSCVKKWKLYRPLMSTTSDSPIETDRWLQEDKYFKAIENVWFEACQVTRGLCVLLEELFQLEHWQNWTFNHCVQQLLTSFEDRLEKQMDFVKHKSYEFQNRKTLDTRHDELTASSPCFLSPYNNATRFSEIRPLTPIHQEVEAETVFDFFGSVKAQEEECCTPKTSKYRHNLKNTRNTRLLLRPKPNKQLNRRFTKKAESLHQSISRTNNNHFFDSIEHQELALLRDWIEKLAEIKQEDWPKVPYCILHYPVLDAAVKLLKQTSVSVTKRLFKQFIIVTSPISLLKNEHSAASESDECWLPATVTFTQDKNLYFNKEQNKQYSSDDVLVPLNTVENVILQMKKFDSNNPIVKLEYTQKLEAKGSSTNKLVNSILRFDSKKLKKHILMKFRNHAEATAWVETIQQTLNNNVTTTQEKEERREVDSYSETIRQFWKLLA